MAKEEKEKKKKDGKAKRPRGRQFTELLKIIKDQEKRNSEKFYMQFVNIEKDEEAKELLDYLDKIKKQIEQREQNKKEIEKIQIYHNIKKLQTELDKAKEQFGDTTSEQIAEWSEKYKDILK